MTIPATNTNSTALETLVTDLELASLDMDQLRLVAEQRKVQLRATDKAGMIDEIIAASVETPNAVEAGTLISLHSKTDKAKQTIAAIRNAQMVNQEGGITWSLFLKNKEGTFYYNKGVPGVVLSNERKQDIYEILSPLPDGSQDALIQEFKDHPENFKDPVLVRVSRTQLSFCMLYLSRKQKIVEQKF